MRRLLAGVADLVIGRPQGGGGHTCRHSRTSRACANLRFGARACWVQPLLHAMPNGTDLRFRAGACPTRDSTTCAADTAPCRTWPSERRSISLLSSPLVGVVSIASLVAASALAPGAAAVAAHTRGAGDRLVCVCAYAGRLHVQVQTWQALEVRNIVLLDGLCWF